MKKWYVLYVRNSTQELKAFKTKKEASKFIYNFPVNDGYWIDLIFKSKDIKIIDDPGIKLVK